MTDEPERPEHLRALTFTVDAALLRELGERLVGAAHIALAELVKNSYDADATEVLIRFESDRIVIGDNGQGMKLEEFKEFWMRVGSPHKQKTALSKRFGRSVTGSKGVGRLSVQFLASKLRIVTVSRTDPNKELYVEVDWKKAQVADDLTRAEAKYAVRRNTGAVSFADASDHGFWIELRDLNDTWDARKLEHLAREVWSLQPPFAESLPDDDPHRFSFAPSEAEHEGHIL
jgi:hypothetical protein